MNFSVAKSRISTAAITAVFGLALTACGGGPKEGEYYPGEGFDGDRNVLNPGPDANESVLDKGFKLFGSSDNKGPSLGVNVFLWRASLDTLSFMPLTTVDSTGGVIITDWHAEPAVPNERFKVTVYILDRELRADGVKVSVFRQEKKGSEWHDATVQAETAAKIENQILRRARELKIGSGN